MTMTDPIDRLLGHVCATPILRYHDEVTLPHSKIKGTSPRSSRTWYISDFRTEDARVGKSRCPAEDTGPSRERSIAGLAGCPARLRI